MCHVLLKLIFTTSAGRQGNSWTRWTSCKCFSISIAELKLNIFPHVSSHRLLWFLAVGSVRACWNKGWNRDAWQTCEYPLLSITVAYFHINMQHFSVFIVSTTHSFYWPRIYCCGCILFPLFLLFFQVQGRINHWLSPLRAARVWTGTRGRKERQELVQATATQ